MIETSTLNVGGDGLSTSSLPDGTAASQRDGDGVEPGVDASALKRGSIDIPSSRIPTFSPDAEGGATKTGDIFTYGGFLGRPQGTQR